MGAEGNPHGPVEDLAHETVLRDPPFRTALVIANPISGSGKAVRAARELVEGLDRAGIATELVLTRQRGEAYTLLRSRAVGTDVVVTVGGDGTLREVLDGLVDPETPVALLPYGTANVMAHQLGLPRDVHQALEIILQAHAVPLDVARVKGRLACLLVGVGFDAVAVRHVESRRTGPISMWTYVRALWTTFLRYRPPRLRVQIEGELQAEAFGYVLISNVSSYGRWMRLASESKLDDGLFEVYLFPSGTRRALACALLRALLHRFPGRRIRVLRARRVSVESEEPSSYQVDGDLGGSTPVEVEVGSTPYRILVPRRN